MTTLTKAADAYQLVAALAGALVVLDTVRGDEEEREQCLREYCRSVESEWSAVSAATIAGAATTS